MSNPSWLDEVFIDSHLHQLRTSLSVIEMALFALQESPSSLMIASASKLIEASYEELLCIKNFDYIHKQSSEPVQVIKFFQERLQYFESSLQVYEIEISKNAQLEVEYTKELNEEFLKRVMDIAIVFLIKNTKPMTKAFYTISESKIEVFCTTHTQQPQLKESSKKIIEMIEAKSQLQLEHEFIDKQGLKLKISF